MDADRRRSPRYAFIADVEVTEPLSDTTQRARTSDLSIGGCFLDMLNPSPKGTNIQVKMSHADSSFTARARVAFVVPNLGMGIAFTDIDRSQVSVLQKWLSQTSQCA
jgi:hypothetical protein